MERRPTSILTTLAVSVLALTLIAPASLGQNPDAIPEIRRLAEQGDVDAQFDLGFMYATGEGVPENDAEAVKWYRLAADQGHVRAKHNLGFMYATGEGVPQDDAYAVRWFRLAAEQGDARAQSLLGGMYADGRGVPQDDAEAVRWYRPWADRGYADAQRSRSARLNVEPLGRRLGHCEEGNRGGGEAVPLNQIEKLSRTLPSCRTRLNVASLVLLCLLGVLATGCGRQPDTPRLEVFPKHFLLHRGEQIHYSVVDPFDDSQLSVDYDLIIEDPAIVRLIEPSGTAIEAVAAGRTEIVVRTPTAERRIGIEVAGPAEPPIAAVHHRELTEIVADEFLFVGHANRDGFDHTAVAKPGIDRLVEEAKRHGTPVVYWVSQEYPNWYTADREPDYAIISEGQEHEIRVDAARVVFTGGDFMYCTLRNTQMTLHGMVQRDGAERIEFVFPADAIWMADIQGPDKRNYPVPMILLSTFFARHADDAMAYEEAVVPFLDHVITEFPVLGYPSDAPTPPLSDLLEDWSVVVRFGERFERVYRHGDSSKTLFVEFQGV